MKKIGLVSLPFYYNYGTQLQLLALQTAIENAGYACEVINYISKWESTKRQLRKRIFDLVLHPYRLPVGLFERFYNTYVSRASSQGFALAKKFEQDFIHIGNRAFKSCGELEASPPQYDAYVVGSDQVWSPLGHFGNNAVFLSFAEKTRRIAYSPSLGVSQISPHCVTWLRNGINGMRFLSVRESTGAELIKEICGCEAQVVVDPTLLVSSDNWRSMRSTFPTPDRYILVYALRGDSYLRRFCKALSKRLNCPIIVLPKHKRDILWFSNGVVRAFDVGPREFLDLFSRAEFVITDSFHGTVFSIQFERPFFSFVRYKDGVKSDSFCRIADFLERLGLQDRIVSKEVLPKYPFAAINYYTVKERLQSWVNDSKNYLTNALNTVTNT